MADTERDIRDRLAEALYRASIGTYPVRWSDVSSKRYWRLGADQLLSALPTVGLRIGRVEE